MTAPLNTASLVSRARAYKPYNHMNDGALIGELADALSEKEGEVAKLTGRLSFALDEGTSWAVKAGLATRQRDEALAALKASEERGDAATKLADRYGVALMMIRAGCSDPKRFAGNILDDVKPVDIDLEDLP